MTTIQIRDEELAGKTLAEFSLDVLTEQITVRELIRSRVYQQVQDKNLAPSPVFGGIVPPTETERTLNPQTPRTRKSIDWKEAYEVAIKAYENNKVLIVVDDKQTESLDQKIEVRTDTRISFVCLLPLAGG